LEASDNRHINLVFDTTFFGRSYGILVFRANGRNIYSRIVDGEKIYYIVECLNYLLELGYTFKSFTIDGRKGVIQVLKGLFPNIPIQLCQFHQAMIIRRYTTNNPKTECGIELKELMRDLTKLDKITFAEKFFLLSKKYSLFLKERNENKEFIHKRLRSAFRSLRTNLPHLFTYKNHSSLNIPNTTNSCDGSFSHWKNKVKIHRGLRLDRKEKMICELIKNS
jgi:hypothetical protein